MKIKTELSKLTDSDLNSLILFALYKSTNLPEQSSLSQLAYILDKDNLIRLCQLFGGIELRIPTLEELEVLVYSLLLFQEVEIEKKDYQEALRSIQLKEIPLDKIEENYILFKELLKDYNFNSGRE